MKPKDQINPPQWASRLLEWLCPDELLEEIQGDLQEMFEERITEVGKKKAKQEYILAVLGYLRPLAFKRENTTTTKLLYTDMLKNYLKIAFRTLQKNKIYSIINLAGLTFACTLCLLVYAFIRHELSFDRFHQKASLIFRVEFTGLGEFVDTGTRNFLSSLTTPDNSRIMRLPPDLATDLGAGLPEITQAFRFTDNEKQIISVNNQKFYQKDICLVDSNFFDLFSFRLLKGNSKTALTDPASVVLSEETAIRYFGKKDPIGQAIEVVLEGGKQLFKVTGIVEEAPSNSSIYFKVLFPFNAKGLSSAEDAPKRNIYMLSTLTLIELDEKTSLSSFKSKLKKFGQDLYKEQLKKRNIPVDRFGIILTPLVDTHLDSVPYGWPRMGKKLNLYVLSLISLLVLLIASLNYIFLALTQASSRLQEVGVRKVTGASRGQLILQFWAETFFLVAISACSGFILSYISLPVFNQLLDTHMEPALLYSMPVWMSAVALALFVSLLTGIYPAILLSRFNPVRLLQRNGTYRINPALSRVMVVIQYALCLFLVISTLVMKEQFRFLIQKDLGFDKENVVVINLMENISMAKGAYLLEKFKVMATSEPDIVAVSGGDDMTSASMLGFYTIHDEAVMINQLSGDYNYAQMLRLDIIEGRYFSPQFPTDTLKNGAVVVNEQLAKLLGKECQVGNPCRFLNNATIIGIVKDFNFTSLSQPIGPALLQYQPSYIPNILIKTSPGNLPATLAKIEKAWKQYNEDKPLNYSFMEENIARMYQSQQRWMDIIGAAASAAILVTCLGLFGLSGLNAVNRTKEIGIRKVLGASVRQIFVLLNKNTIRLAIISFLIAFPIAYYFSYHWLQDFSYRITLGWEMFTIAGGVGLLIVFIAVSYYSIKAALANPVNSLRNE